MLSHIVPSLWHHYVPWSIIQSFLGRGDWPSGSGCGQIEQWRKQLEATQSVQPSFDMTYRFHTDYVTWVSGDGTWPAVDCEFTFMLLLWDARSSPGFLYILWNASKLALTRVGPTKCATLEIFGGLQCMLNLRLVIFSTFLTFCGCIICCVWHKIGTLCKTCNNLIITYPTTPCVATLPWAHSVLRV